MGNTANIPFVDPQSTPDLGPVGMGSSTPPPATTPPQPAPSPIESQNPPPTPQAPPAQPSGVTVSPDGTARPQSIPSRVYHGILDALGGTNDVQLSRDASGKMIATSVAKTPGAQWKQIIGGALAGLAGGAGQVGPGKFGRAAGAGINAGMQQAQQQQKAKVDAANADYDEQQKTLVRKAQLQQIAVQTAASSFSLERAKVNAEALDSKMLNDHMDWIKDNGGSEVGTFKDYAAVSQYAKNDPALAADIAHGRIAVTPHIENVKAEDGTEHQQVTGIDVARVPDQWGNQLNDKDLPIDRMVPGADGKPATWETETIPAGTIKNSDYNAAVLATVAQRAKAEGDVVEENYKKAQTREANSEANKNNVEAKQLNEAGDTATIQSNAAQLVHGSMDPANLSKRSKTYDATLAAANDISMRETGKPFDTAKATADYKFASNPQTKNTLNYLNSLTGRDNNGGNLGTVIQLSTALHQGKFPALNDADQWAKLSSGNPQVAAYRAALVETSDQIAKILQGGGTGNGTSDKKLEQAQDLLDRGFNTQQMAAVANTMRDLLGNRKKEMIGDNRYLTQWYGSGQTQITVTDPKGGTHIFGSQADADKFKKLAGIQ
jgi:hypothetical protein